MFDLSAAGGASGAVAGPAAAAGVEARAVREPAVPGTTADGAPGAGPGVATAVPVVGAPGASRGSPGPHDTAIAVIDASAATPRTSDTPDARLSMRRL